MQHSLSDSSEPDQSISSAGLLEGSELVEPSMLGGTSSRESSSGCRLGLENVTGWPRQHSDPLSAGGRCVPDPGSVTSVDEGLG